jgi:hypothetical protein
MHDLVLEADFYFFVDKCPALQQLSTKPQCSVPAVQCLCADIEMLNYQSCFIEDESIHYSKEIS